jgi:endonuclease-3
MNNSEKSNFILAKLNILFPTPQMGLKFKDSFTCLVSTMLSAQCTDAAVNRVTADLFPIADTPQGFLALGENELRKIIHRCGFFNTKARAIIGTARLILDKHGGCVPQTFEELEKLPGVGHKTASVVLGQCFNKPAFPVDTHIARLANRWGLEKSLNVKKIEAALKEFFPENSWKNLHLQMILYGRQFCPARGHVIANCPICQEFAKETSSLNGEVRQSNGYSATQN